jgi:chromosome segregation ATPase
MEKMIFTTVFLLTLTACAGMPGGPALHTGAAPRDQIEAENRLMRNNLSLAVRENEVLKEENLRYKSEVTQLSDCVARLTADIEAKDSLHQDRMAEIMILFDQLRLQQSEMEMDYCLTVDELRSSNAAIGKETSAKLEELTAALKRRDEASRDAVAAVKAEFDEKLEKYAREVSAIERLLTETQAALKDLGERMENFSTARQEVRSQMEAIQTSIADIRRKINDLEEAIQAPASIPLTPAPAGPPAVGAGGEAQGAK